ncbi:LOW QUALITY PROTEIN: hypothetical protein O9K51_07313 [Purpureocillium lavendulum]|uniref:Uncharacterized protein n=1 Tax=Purpureocillium lavendulum TaxID=1247861 RepID=A0AB34FKH2_9HYPO|nr:LOW QUALITY PROTEIN: hypothetical protein O9K51_07313 [Purpureocillium lavendulum]
MALRSPDVVEAESHRDGGAGQLEHRQPRTAAPDEPQQVVVWARRPVQGAEFDPGLAVTGAQLHAHGEEVVAAADSKRGDRGHRPRAGKIWPDRVTVVCGMSSVMVLVGSFRVHDGEAWPCHGDDDDDRHDGDDDDEGTDDDDGVAALQEPSRSQQFPEKYLSHHVVSPCCSTLPPGHVFPPPAVTDARPEQRVGSRTGCEASAGRTMGRTTGAARARAHAATAAAAAAAAVDVERQRHELDGHGRRHVASDVARQHAEPLAGRAVLARHDAQPHDEAAARRRDDAVGAAGRRRVAHDVTGVGEAVCLGSQSADDQTTTPSRSLGVMAAMAAIITTAAAAAAAAVVVIAAIVVIVIVKVGVVEHRRVPHQQGAVLAPLPQHLLLQAHEGARPALAVQQRHVDAEEAEQAAWSSGRAVARPAAHDMRAAALAAEAEAGGPAHDPHRHGNARASGDALREAAARAERAPRPREEGDGPRGEELLQRPAAGEPPRALERGARLVASFFLLLLLQLDPAVMTRRPVVVGVVFQSRGCCETGGPVVVRHVGEIGKAARGAAVPPEHGVDGLGQLRAARLVDAHRVDPSVREAAARQHEAAEGLDLGPAGLAGMRPGDNVLQRGLGALLGHPRVREDGVRRRPGGERLEGQRGGVEEPHLVAPNLIVLANVLAGAVSAWRTRSRNSSTKPDSLPWEAGEAHHGIVMAVTPRSRPSKYLPWCSDRAPLATILSGLNLMNIASVRAASGACSVTATQLAKLCLMLSGVRRLRRAAFMALKPPSALFGSMPLLMPGSGTRIVSALKALLTSASSRSPAAALSASAAGP